MKYYELTYLSDKNLTEDEQKGLSEKVVSFLPNPPTKKEDLSYLSSLEFYSKAEKIQEVEKNLKAEPKISKFMIVVKKIGKVIKSRHPRIKEPSLAKTSESKEKKVELKEIEKKLDEILKDES